MTRDKLESMTLGQILYYIKKLEHENLVYKRQMRERLEARKALELASATEVARGNVTAIYYQDEITGLHMRAERATQYVLNNSPKGAA